MNKRESFDGLTVALYDGKFSGSFDLEDDAATTIGLDDMVTLVVTARVSGAAHSETKVGDVKRTNTFKVSKVVVLDPSQVKSVTDALDGVAVPSVDELKALVPNAVIPAATLSEPATPELDLGGQEERIVEVFSREAPPSAMRVDDTVLKRFLES